MCLPNNKDIPTTQNQKLKVSIIVAKAANNAIGINNGLPWHLPSDLRHFKRTTLGHHVIMGRKTFESLGKPLPGRVHFVISRNTGYSVPEGHFVFPSIEAALKAAESKQLKNVFILGGAEIYRQALPFVDEMIITEVHASPVADAYFPNFDEEEWEETDRKKINKDETNDEYSLDFVTYKKKLGHKSSI